MTRYEIAQKYRQCGLPVIPVGANKIAFEKWKEYQTRFPSDDELSEWFKGKKTNMALVTGPMSDCLMVDADEYKRPGAIKDVEDRLGGVVCPVQVTPRGGRHYLFAHREGLRNRADYVPGIDVRTTGGYFVAWPSLSDNGKMWSWMEGRSLFDVSLPQIPDSLFDWLKLLLKSQEQTDHKEDSAIEWFKDGRRDIDLFRTAETMARSGAPHALIHNVLTRLVNSWGENDPQWVRAKVESATKYVDEREVQVREEIKEWIKAQTGSFMFTLRDVFDALQLSTRTEKKNASTVLHKLTIPGPDKMIDPCGTKRGQWKRYSSDLEIMDFVNADPEDFYHLRWPLELERKTRVFPKSIIVIAGVTGTGKTSYILNFIQENMTNFPILYFNSEMDERAMNYKLRQFDHDGMFPPSAWTFKMLKWKGNPDVIDPDAINIVDYLSAGNNAYEIQEPIGRILSKLNRGIAIISVQKRPGSPFGTGGIYSAMDASLVIALEFSRMKVTKNRFREADNFMNLDCRDWTIKHGLVRELSGWYGEEDKEANKKGFQREKKPLHIIKPGEFVPEQEGWES